MRHELRTGITQLIEELARLAAHEPPPAPADLRAAVRATLAGSGAAHRVALHWDARRGRHDATVIVSDPELGGAMTFEARGTPGALPLTLLASHAWSERDVLRVDGHTLAVEDVIAAVDFLWSDVAIATRLVDLLILRDELEREPVTIDDAVLQAGVDAFRARNGLTTVAATSAWLHERGMTLAELEALVETDLAVAAAVRRRVARDAPPGTEVDVAQAAAAWLAGRRAAATIEWNWGKRAATDRLTAAIRR